VVPEPHLWAFVICSRVNFTFTFTLLSLQFEEKVSIDDEAQLFSHNYEGWNFNSGNYLFTTDTK